MSIVGTFMVMYVLGYTIDNLSLMALTLSLDIKDRTHMDRVMARLRKISGVDQVERVIR